MTKRLSPAVRFVIPAVLAGALLTGGSGLARAGMDGPDTGRFSETRASGNSPGS